MSYLGKEIELEAKIDKKIKEEGNFKKILFIGLAQTGKTSIINVVFSGWKPEDTNNLPATVNFSRQIKDFSNINILVYDLGGQTSFLDKALVASKELLFSNLHAIFYVVDASNFGQYQQSRKYFLWAMRTAAEFNETTKINLFVHKMDLLPNGSEDEVVDQIAEIFNLNELEDIKLSRTSIFDSSIFDVIKDTLVSL
ncbi:MAG: 50S ribosome-binding GTPase [Candidatus Heimdallarchaeota archaeon]|nr:50S ribosome-binding GTPase [Candidatus Heimdallarchaeota archaeon]